MAKEIERKFLVVSDDWRAAADAGTALRQAYLCIEPDRSLRVRIGRDGSARLTLKLGVAALSRDEFEYDIPRDDAEAMVAACIGRVIEKRRYRVPEGAHVWEVDVFAGALSGLVIAEVELSDVAEEPRLPSWLGAEVTGDPAFLNAGLALHGVPEERAR